MLFPGQFRGNPPTCSRAECPHKRRRWSKGFWGRRRRAGGSGPVQGRSTRRWTPESQTLDSWSHSPPPWACPARSEHWCTRWPRHSRNWGTRPRGSGRRRSAGRTGAGGQRTGEKKETSANIDAVSDRYLRTRRHNSLRKKKRHSVGEGLQALSIIIKWKGWYLELKSTWREEVIFYLSEMSAANIKTTKLRKNQREIQTWRQ